MPEYYPINTFLGWSFPVLPYIISGGVLPAEAKAVLFGPVKIGKSLLLNQMALSICNGIDWVGFKTMPKRVLYHQFEVPNRPWQRRMVKYRNKAGISPKDNLVMAADLRGLKLDTVPGQTELESGIAKFQAEVVILDPFYKMMVGSENTGQDVLVVLDFLDHMIHQYKISVLICAHSRKTRMSQSGGAADFGSQELRGAGQLSGWVDTIINMIPVSKDNVRLDFKDTRHAEDEIPPVKLRLDRALAGFVVVP